MRRARSLSLQAGSLVAVVVAAAALGAPAVAYGGVPAGAEYSEAYFKSADGTTLHADVLRPKGLRPDARVPVLMTVTPYAGHGAGYPPDPTAEPPSYGFLHVAETVRAFERGYAVVMVDLRGFGGSGGCWDVGGRGEQSDVKAAVEWAASQPWSTGKVALAGLSYDGWTGIMGLATRPRGLAAVVGWAPVVDAYTALYMNRLPHWLLATYAPYYSGFSHSPPTIYDNPAYFGNWLAHARPECQDKHALDLHDPDPNSAFWRERDLFERAAASDVPVLGTQGFLDYNVPPDQLPYLYPRLKNRGGLWLGQFLHQPITSPRSLGRSGVSQLDRFLQRTLLGRHPTVEDPPVSVQEAPNLRWRNERSWPPADARRFDVPLRAGAYADRAGNGAGDNIAGAPIPAPLPAERLPSGIGSWTFTKPLPHSVHLAGSPRVSVHAEGPSDARLVALLYDVAPDNSALLITRGATLVGDGRPSVTLYPQDWRLAPGHRLGLLISGADDSWWIPRPSTGAQVQVRSGWVSVPALDCLRNEFAEGSRGTGWDQVKRPIRIDPATLGGATVSSALPPPQASGGRCARITQVASRCLARRSPIGIRNVGRIRIGFTRRRLLRLPVKPVRRTRRSYRYCVKSSRGRVTAAFSRRGRVTLVTTTARHHGNRRVRPGRSARSLRRGYPRRRSLGRSLYRANPRSAQLFGTRRGRVRFIAVADRRLLRKPRTLTRYLRLAGL